MKMEVQQRDLQKPHLKAGAVQVAGVTPWHRQAWDEVIKIAIMAKIIRTVLLLGIFMML